MDLEEESDEDLPTGCREATCSRSSELAECRVEWWSIVGNFGTLSGKTGQVPRRMRASLKPLRVAPMSSCL